HAAAAVDRSHQTGHRLHHAHALASLATATLLLGDRDTAQARATAAHMIHKDAGARVGEAETLVVLARCATDPERAMTYLHDAQNLLAHAHAATDHVDALIRTLRT
ncbi:hypothetical protein, partial [Lentzea indica]|uniref:hypothetical protein n=1 Tax=Lentzea indica TaxID=2604800 RepID=UPI0014394084